MKQISGNCILPFGLWGEDPPDHLISCIEIIDDAYIVTGDKLGQMIVWKMGCDDKIFPIWYLLGHCGSISTIIRSMISENNDRYIISVSSHWEMGVWNCADGRCLRLERHLTVEHKAIRAYQSSNSKTALLVCCGHYAGIQVLDSMTLKLLFCLQSRAHSDWIRSVCVIQHKQREMDVVLGLSISGAITMWTIESTEGLREDKVLFETESKMLLLTCPLSISICPSKPRIVMVLASTSVHIYDAASWSILSESYCPESCFMTGWFLDHETILLRQKNGQCRLYNVPISNLDNESNGLRDLVPMCYLDSGDDDVACESVSVKDGKLMIAVAGSTGTVYWWKMGLAQLKTCSPEPVMATDHGNLKDHWTRMDMASVTRPFRREYSITCCHCEPSIDSLIMGTSSGEILTTQLLQYVAETLFRHDAKPPPYSVLKGHTRSVLALRYAKILANHDSVNDTQWLWSGGEDFSVRLWNLDAGVCVNVFHCHSGPVISFLVGPPLGLTKGKHDGKIMAPKKAAEAEQEVLRPINLNTWFGHRLYVSFDDSNGVAFLSLETRRVVLQLSLFSAVQTIGWRRDQVSVVLECADGSATIWDLGSGLLDRREMGQIAEDIVEASTDHVRLSRPPPVLPRVAHLKDRLKHSTLSSVQLHSVPVGHGRSAQVLLLDTESLLMNIHAPISSATGQDASRKALLETQLLLSLINQWTDDQCLDTTLQSTVGLVRPPRHVCQGHLSTRTRTLSFPLHRDEHRDHIGTSMALLAGVSLCHAINNLPDTLLPSKWPRLASFISVADADTMTTKTAKPTIIADNRTEVRQVCCFYATSMAIASLAKILSPRSTSSSSPGPMDMARVALIMQTFVHKYQDRCLEIREAARTLLHASLDLLSTDQRHDLVQFWSHHGRVTMSHSDVSPTDPTYRISQDHLIKTSHSLSSIFEAPAVADWRHWVVAVTDKRQVPLEIEQLQATALSFLGIVGSRYGSPDVQLSPASNAISASMIRSQPIDKVIRGFGLEDYRLARTTCGFLMGLLNAGSAVNDQKSSSGTHWSTLRCLAVTVLGQGFPVWEPYLEIPMLFTRLLETVAPAERVLAGWTQGQILTDEMNAVHCARSSLHAIALARPKVFATALSIEVLRLQTQSSQGSASSSPATNVPGINSTVTSSSSSMAGSTTNGFSVKTGTALVSQSQPPLLAARHEVIEVIKMLCEKKTREIHDVLPEIMDILLACLSKLDLRTYDLQQLFPPVLLFRIASSHTASGKVCVGTRSGNVVFYDVKIGKYNTSAGHGGAVTSVTFSPDGKQMASYSMPDNTVCIWQLFSSGLFGMGSSHQVKLASRLNVPPVAVSETVAEEDSSLLLWLEWSENKAIHLVTNAGLINKIKL